MSGILDKKSRFIDYKLTVNGREQISIDDLRFKFATFSDRSIVYYKDHDKSNDSKVNVDGSEFYYMPIEASINDSGNISNEFKFDSISKKYSDTYVVKNDEIALGITNDRKLELALDKIKEISIGEKLIAQNIILKKSNLTPSYLSFTKETNLGTDYFDFVNKNVVNSYPTIINENTNIKNIDPIYFDKRFESKINFLKMPPINSRKQEIFNNNVFEFDTKRKTKSNIDFLFKVYNERIDIEDINDKEKTLKNIVSSLKYSSKIFNKEYTLKEEDDIETFILEFFEVPDNVNTEDNTMEIEKLLFINAGSFYDNISNSYKDIYMIGKILYNDSISDAYKEADYLFKNNNIDIQGIRSESQNVLVNKIFNSPENYESTIFKLSTLYSFLNMFVIVAE